MITVKVVNICLYLNKDLLGFFFQVVDRLIHRHKKWNSSEDSILTQDGGQAKVLKLKHWCNISNMPLLYWH